MFRKIIIPTEASAAAMELLKHVSGLHDLGTREVLLLECSGCCETDAVSANFVDSVLKGNIISQKEMLEDQGFIVETRITKGLPETEINRIAISEDFSMIVTGAQKHILSGEIFFGGLAYDIIHYAQKPVLIIRLNDEDGKVGKPAAAGSPLCRHILFPTDFSENAAAAFEYLKFSVIKGAGKVTLLHVHDKEMFDSLTPDQILEFSKKDMEKLQNMQLALQDQSDIEINVVLSEGSPAEEILKKIRELDVSLVVMGSQGKGYIKELFVGSVSRQIARHSDSSVMLIPMIRSEENSVEKE